jgi:hypothetical protein
LYDRLCPSPDAFEIVYGATEGELQLIGFEVKRLDLVLPSLFPDGIAFDPFSKLPLAITENVSRVGTALQSNACAGVSTLSDPTHRSVKSQTNSPAEQSGHLFQVHPHRIVARLGVGRRMKDQAIP